MRKLAWLVALLLLAVGAEAQDGSYIKYYRAPVAGTSGGGATFTAPVLLSDGTAVAPALGFTSSTNTGIYLAGGAMLFTIAGTPRLQLSASFLLGSSGTIRWGDHPSVAIANPDLYLARYAAAILQLGPDAATAVAQTFKGPDSTGATVAGASLTLKGGAGTSGIANGGALILSGGANSSTGEPGAVAIADGGTKPTCAAGIRGSIWYDAGGAGVADTFEVCAKAAAGDVYAWRILATIP